MNDGAHEIDIISRCKAPYVPAVIPPASVSCLQKVFWILKPESAFISSDDSLGPQ